MNTGLFNIFKKKDIQDILRHCAVSSITAWCLVLFVNMAILKSEGINPVNSIASVGYTDFVMYISVLVILCVILTFVSVSLDVPDISNAVMFMSVFWCALMTVYLKRDVYVCLVVTGLVMLAFLYVSKSGIIEKIRISRQVQAVIIIMAAAGLAAFIGVTAVYRYRTYCVPNYDGGLFMQMFYYMREHFTMQTTLERDMLMSHMSVHISPVFWLIYPLYAIFPHAWTIQISQGIVLAMAVIPLFMICKKKKYDRFQTALICASYCFMPYVAGGCGYDIHENMFLPLAVFTLLYAFECESWISMAAAMLFILGIKEDAAVYSGFIGLYMLVSGYRDKKKCRKAVLVMAASVIYFVAAVMYIRHAGMNTAVNRFNNMIYGADGNLLGIIQTVLVNPGYAISQIMAPDNIKYIITVLAPMIFLPLYCHDYRLYIFAGPFILFNLLPDYQYMHNIDFQYTFGSASLLFYMVIESLKRPERRNVSRTLCMMLLSAVLFFTSELSERYDYVKMYREPSYKKICDIMDEALAYIPDDAEVTASTFLCARLSKRDYLYEDYYTDKQTEYVAIDLRGLENTSDILTEYSGKGYETICYEEGIIAVFRRK